MISGSRMRSGALRPAIGSWARCRRRETAKWSRSTRTARRSMRKITIVSPHECGRIEDRIMDFSQRKYGRRLWIAGAALALVGAEGLFHASRAQENVPGGVQLVAQNTAT